MGSNAVNIDRIRVATPCPISWEQMTGDQQVRFCDHCQLNVYNISELSRGETQSLIASTEGRLCIKLYRRADGTVLTKDCPVGLRALRLRVSKRAAAIFAAVAGLSSLVFGQEPSGKNGKTVCTNQVGISRTNQKSDSAGEVLRGTITDSNGAPVSGAKIAATNFETKKVETRTSNDDGSFEFKSVAAGSYSIEVKLLGFKSLLVTSLTVEKLKLTNLDLILEPSTVTEVVGLYLTAPSLIETPPGTTIINEQMIRRLPIQK